MYDYELLHYGVKGMKWGVRKAQKKDQLRNRYANTLSQFNKDARRAAKVTRGIADENKRYASRATDEALRKSYMDDAEEYEHLFKEYTAAGKIYLEGNKKLMSLDVNSVSKRDIKKIYKKAVLNGWKLESYPAYEFLSD